MYRGAYGPKAIAQEGVEAVGRAAGSEQFQLLEAFGALDCSAAMRMGASATPVVGR